MVFCSIAGMSSYSKGALIADEYASAVATKKIASQVRAGDFTDGYW